MKNNIVSSKFYIEIKSILDEARHKTFKSINFFMVDAYWNIGKRIVGEEQKGEKRAEYGAYLLRDLAEFLAAGLTKVKVIFAQSLSQRLAPFSFLN